VKDIENVTIRYKAYDFLLMFYSNYMAPSRVVSEIFNVEKYRDLEIPVKSRAPAFKIFVTLYTPIRFDRERPNLAW